MKLSIQSRGKLLTGLLPFLCFTIVIFFAGCQKEHHEPKEPVFALSTVASGLESPMGIDADKHGNIWVTLAGNLKAGAKVAVIKPNGKVYDAVINLSVITNQHSGELQGAGHLMLDGDLLFVLSGDFLYKIDVSHFNPGHEPINAATQPYEDVGAFVKSYPWVYTTLRMTLIPIT